MRLSQKNWETVKTCLELRTFLRIPDGSLLPLEFQHIYALTASTPSPSTGDSGELASPIIVYVQDSNEISVGG